MYQPHPLDFLFVAQLGWSQPVKFGEFSLALHFQCIRYPLIFSIPSSRMTLESSSWRHDLKAFLLIVLLAILFGDVGYGLQINITVLDNATTQGAVCLDGSPPAYYFDKGFDTGLSNWIIFLDIFHIIYGGGWCESIPDCNNRSITEKGSSKNMKNQSQFAGILHSTPRQNPDFYNWNRVWVNYCDGPSFTGDVEHVDPENKLYFRGARLFKVAMVDLWRKGMQYAKNAILSGTSTGGLATILNCDKCKSFFPDNAVKVKFVANAGFFINANTIFGTPNIQNMYERVVNLHESAKRACTPTMEPSLCFFPENIIPYIETPLFIINSAYDAWHISNTLVPSNLDPQHAWEYCRDQISNCTSSQIINIQAFGAEFLNILKGLTPCYTRGYFITSWHTHARIVLGDYGFDATSPRILNKTIAEAIGDWYFDRTTFHQHIDLYPGARCCKRST
ncbi:pectin acetylesterase 11-like [Solanum stenotomum]|uniref:pectin acetylesterase 11-like n=1 Tax=Solanum stenotomum TaxID=172797 RepID=UPI0020D035CD|nr:pectin acetylesterase 11-like [Solanum stenotomum]